MSLPKQEIGSGPLGGTVQVTIKLKHEYIFIISSAIDISLFRFCIFLYAQKCLVCYIIMCAGVPARRAFSSIKVMCEAPLSTSASDCLELSAVCDHIKCGFIAKGRARICSLLNFNFHWVYSHLAFCRG